MAEVPVRLSAWNRERRMIFVRQHVPARPKATGKQLALFAGFEDHREHRYGAMVTNEDSLSPLEVWRAYRPRAKMWNMPSCDGAKEPGPGITRPVHWDL